MVVETRIARFLAELDVLHVRLGGHDAVVVLPGAQQLVQILGAHLSESSFSISGSEFRDLGGFLLVR